jgi:hypothetical protein
LAEQDPFKIKVVGSIPTGGTMKELTEYDALIKEYGEDELTYADKAMIQWTMMELGVRADAPAGTAKHHLEAYDKMMKVALPVFKFEADRDNGPYAHIPYCTFKHIDETNPDKAV